MKKDEFKSLFKAPSHLKKCLASQCCKAVLSSSNGNIGKYRVFPQKRLNRWSSTIAQLGNLPKLVFLKSITYKNLP